MRAVLLDTSILVADERGALDMAGHVAEGVAEIAISAVTASELLLGVARRPLGVARVRAERVVETVLAGVRVLPVDMAVARVHAAVRAELQRRGQVLGAHDMLIAATALAYDYELATRDRAFDRVPGLVVHHW